MFETKAVDLNKVYILCYAPTFLSDKAFIFEKTDNTATVMSERYRR